MTTACAMARTAEPPVIVLRETGSTNDDIESLLRSELFRGADPAGFHGYTVRALKQTAGRGRFDRRWDSSPGGLYQSTLVFRDMLGGVDMSRIVICAALAAFDAVRSALPEAVPVNIKWPNDIAAGGKKVAGMLLKALAGDPMMPVIIGTGINVSNEVDPASLRGAAILPPGRLCDMASKALDETDIGELSLLLRRSLFSNLAAAADGDGRRELMERYNRALLYRGTEVEVFDRVECGCAMARGIFSGIDGDGHIIIESGGRSLTLASGEIRMATKEALK